MAYLYKKKKLKEASYILAQMQVLKVYLITGIFKAISVQILNIKIYLICIGFKLDKKIDQTKTWLYFKFLYYTFTQSQFIHLKKTLTLLKVFKKCYIKLFNNNIHKLEKNLAYIIAF